jgi:hypothetical protein
MWNNYIHPNDIILTQQMRQNKYINYATLLQKFQNEIISYSDFDLLKTRFSINANVNFFNDPWKTTTYIILRNEL